MTQVANALRTTIDNGTSRNRSATLQAKGTISHGKKQPTEWATKVCPFLIGHKEE